MKVVNWHHNPWGLSFSVLHQTINSCDNLSKYLTLWAKLIPWKLFVFNSEQQTTFTWTMRQQPGKQVCTVWLNTGGLQWPAIVCYPSWLTPKWFELRVQTVSKGGGRGLCINRWSETNERLGRLCRPLSARTHFNTSFLTFLNWSHTVVGSLSLHKLLFTVLMWFLKSTTDYHCVSVPTSGNGQDMEMGGCSCRFYLKVSFWCHMLSYVPFQNKAILVLSCCFLVLLSTSLARLTFDGVFKSLLGLSIAFIHN